MDLDQSLVEMWSKYSLSTDFSIQL